MSDGMNDWMLMTMKLKWRSLLTESSVFHAIHMWTSRRASSSYWETHSKFPFILTCWNWKIPILSKVSILKSKNNLGCNLRWLMYKPYIISLTMKYWENWPIIFPITFTFNFLRTENDLAKFKRELDKFTYNWQWRYKSDT